MPPLLRDFFSSELFMPHGHCYLWKPELVWLQVISNGLIGLAYVAISSTLALLVYRIRDIPFKVMYLAFGTFIVTCGVTHFFDVWVIWNPTYWVDGAMRGLTAIASVGTALFLPPLIPKAVSLVRGAKAAHDRGIQLETAVRDLGTMYEKAKELEELKTQLFANISHELRTPLALIIGPTGKLLAADNLAADQRRDLELIARNGRTLLKHVNDLLDVAKLEAGKVEPEYARVDLVQLVRLIASQFEALAAERGITFSLQASGTLGGEVDPAKLERVLLNLLSNAFKFTPLRGRVRCSIAAQVPGQEGGPQRAVIEVADSGPGIRPEHRAAVFERFRQLEGGSTRRFGGTGLGLAIVKDLVTLHGGAISVNEAPEGGALFRVELPQKAPSGAKVRSTHYLELDGATEETARQTLAELRTRDETVAPPPAVQGDAPLVLVVEDSREMNQFVCQALSGSCRTTSAFDGDAGLKAALEQRPDLVVCDVMMPGLSGDQLVRELRARSELAGTPILLLTAKVDDELRVGMLRAGAQDFLAKPFARDELRLRAANLISTKRARDILQRELNSQTTDIEALAREAVRAVRAPERSSGT